MADSETTGFLFGSRAVATAGTPVPISATARYVNALTIIAHSDNAGRIFYGGDDVDDTTQAGLRAGESITLNNPEGPFDMATIYIDCESGNTDGVDIVAALA